MENMFGQTSDKLITVFNFCTSNSISIMKITDFAEEINSFSNSSYNPLEVSLRNKICQK